MAITRRQFIQRGAIAAAAIAAPHPFRRAMLGARDALASGPAGAIVVVVQLQGGNDGLNTVIPIDDVVGFPQRSLYDTARPTIGIPAASLTATEVDVDPSKGNRLALHPAMADMKSLYDAGLVAVVNGVGYPSQNLSHFRSEDIWFSANPVTQFVDGWFGRYLESAFTPADLVAVDMDSTLCPIFIAEQANVLAVRRLADFTLTDDPMAPDLAAKKAALDAMYAVEANASVASGLELLVGTAGDVLLSKIDDYAAIATGWSSHLDGQTAGVAKALKQVASIIRYDATHPSTPVAARFLHVRIGGFDNHTNQGGVTGTQATLLQRVSTAIKSFHDDMVDLGVSNKILMMTFSEFGRRVAENGGAGNAGTDHGAASPLFVIGDAVNGGVYGTVPALNDLDSSRNLKFQIDFRRVYATVIDKWLATPGAHVPLLPGAPYATLPFLT